MKTKLEELRGTIDAAVLAYNAHEAAQAELKKRG